MEMVLYTRSGCHLCDDAKVVLEAARGEFGFALREVNIDGDAALRERFAFEIPVALLDGREVARHRIDPGRLRQRLREARRRAR